MIDQFYPPVPGQSTGPTEEQRDSALRITIIASLLLVAIAAISIRVALQGSGTGYISVVLASTFAIICIVCAILSARGFVFLSSYIMIANILLVTLALPYLAAGQVTAPAIASLVMVSIIATSTLPSYWSIRASLVSICLSVLVIIADLYLPTTFGIHSRQIAAVPLSVALAVFYFWFILRKFDTYTLRLKLLLTFILVTIIPLTILGIYNNMTTRASLTEQGNVELKNLTTLTAAQVDAFISNELDSLRVQAQQPQIVFFLDQDPLSVNGRQGQTAALQTLTNFVRKDPLFIESYGILDAQGLNILDTDDENIGRRENQDKYFTEVMKTGEVYATNLIFDETTPDIIFASPVRSASGATIGVLRVEINAGILQSILTTMSANRPASESLSLVDTEYYLRLADTGDRNDLYKSYREMSEANINSLQGTGILKPGSPQDAIAPSEAVLWSLQNIELFPFFTAYSDYLKDNAVMTASPLNNIGWLVVAGRAESSLYTPIRAQTRGIVIISLLLILTAALASVFSSRILMEPISALTLVAHRISTGYLTARAQASTHDEIGTLASAFNNMTFQLRQALTGLEHRVRERTADLEQARQLSDGRAQRLQAISDVARAVSAEQNLEKLLPLVAQLVSEKFNFYHTGIFLVDPSHKFAVLRATNSEGGQIMLARGHRLEIGQTGIVGYVAHSGEPRIALDVGADASYFNNPDLPETRSEMALPLVSRGQVIGVLDVQSRQPGAFTKDDVNTLAIMADQIAIAIENARLFGQSEQSLEEVRALYSQYLRQEWQVFTQQENKVGYLQTISGGRLLDEPVENEHIQKALQTGKIQLLAGGNGTQPRVVVPIILRGETIGVMNIGAPKDGRQWSQDEMNLIQAVTDRLALALDNARLLQESLRRAAKEQKIGQITTKIGASINMRNMLQTAVEELGRALPGSDVIIQFERPGEVAEQNRTAK